MKAGIFDADFITPHWKARQVIETRFPSCCREHSAAVEIFRRHFECTADVREFFVAVSALGCQHRTHKLQVIDEYRAQTMPGFQTAAAAADFRNRNRTLIVVDYLQLLHSANPRMTSRVEIIDEICRGLKSLAKELKVPVIALAQLNRSPETRNDKRPMLSDLRDSGAIEQEADMVGFLYRDGYYNQESPEPDLTEFIIAKQRNGPTGMVRLRFLKEHTMFVPYGDESHYSPA